MGAAGPPRWLGSRLCSARVSPVRPRLPAELLTLLLRPRSSLHDPQPERPTADVCDAPARQVSRTRPLGLVAVLVCHEDLLGSPRPPGKHRCLLPCVC